MSSTRYLRKPEWLKVKLPTSKCFSQTRKLLADLNLNTVCQGARCPNIFECFSKKTATFLILGKFCTRNCAFCNIEHNKPEPVDLEEPVRVVEAVKRLQLEYVVITSVTRDDLPDGGASQFKKVIELLKQNLNVRVEVLIPDFKGSYEALKIVLDAKPNVLNHNVETVPSLYRKIRPQADFEQSLLLLKRTKNYNSQIKTKSGLMLGLGETKTEVIEVLEKLVEVRCDLVTLGQYLQPSRNHYPVKRYVHPDEFLEFKQIGEQMGLKVFSGPFVRSSYHAADWV
ncbi:lipoyl synthase [Desulfonauticus submarinus]